MASLSQAERMALAKRGHAMPDGSFPVREGNVADLRNAIHDVGRAADPAKAKQFLIRRARAMQLKSEIPIAWQ